jgi:hypothetical protein
MKKQNHVSCATHPTIVSEMLMKSQRTRRNVIKQMNRQRSGCNAYIASLLGYNSYQDVKERKAVWNKAAKIFDCYGDEDAMNKITGSKKITTDIIDGAGLFIVETKKSLKSFADLRKIIENQMVSYVQQLPIIDWWNAEKGRSYLGLAVIIGETGNLSNYANPAKLWKRMGVAVMDGTRQGGLPKNAPKELWMEHGKSPRRRSVLWTIGDCLLKTNGADGRYKKLYDEQKIRYLARFKKEWLAEGNKATTYKPGHAHNCAQRYMEKRVLRDLWNAWNGKVAPV